MRSGLRWGELTALRVRDLDFAARMLTVSRAVVQVDHRLHPDNGRFLVKPYPKDSPSRATLRGSGRRLMAFVAQLADAKAGNIAVETNSEADRRFLSQGYAEWVASTEVEAMPAAATLRRSSLPASA